MVHFDATATSTLIILIIIFVLVILAIAIALLIICQLTTKPKENENFHDPEKVILESGNVQPSTRRQDRRSIESAFGYYCTINSNLRTVNSDSTFVYYI